MVAKFAIFAFLAISFVFLAPNSVESKDDKKSSIRLDVNAKLNATVNAEVNATLQLRSLHDSLDKLKEKFHIVIEQVKVEWEKVRGKSQVTYQKVMKNVAIMKVQGEKLLEVVEKTVKEFVDNGEAVYGDISSLLKTVKEAYKSIKESGEGIDQDFKEVISELIKTASNAEVLIAVKKE